MELTPNAEFKPADQHQRVALSALTGKVMASSSQRGKVLEVAVVRDVPEAPDHGQ